MRTGRGHEPARHHGNCPSCDAIRKQMRGRADGGARCVLCSCYVAKESWWCTSTGACRTVTIEEVVAWRLGGDSALEALRERT